MMRMMAAAVIAVASGAGAQGPVRSLDARAVATMDLEQVRAAAIARCSRMDAALTELYRRHPGGEKANCGVAVPPDPNAADFARMTDDQLMKSVETIGTEMQLLAMRGTALKNGQAPAAAREPARAPAGPAPATATPAAGAGGPPVGKYYCYMGPRHDMVGRIWIMPGQQYKILENGEVGRFRVDPASHAITWLSGANAKLKRRGWHLAPGVADRLRNEADSQRHSVVMLEEGFDKTPFEASAYATSPFEKCYIPSG